MPLDEKGVRDVVAELLELRDAETPRLKRIRDYLRDDPDRPLAGLPAGAPAELHTLARVSRVNVLKFVVASRVQSMYVDGYRTPRSADDAPAWQVWQRNRMDARQIGVHRAALAYGAAYLTVLPGEPVPVMRGASPRTMTVAYGDDDDWPRYALQEQRRGSWRLLDDEAVYWLDIPDGDAGQAKLLKVAAHDATMDGEPVCPVVRYRDTEDLDEPVVGVVEPYIPLQDQINITSFGLQVAQHYGAFRQRYIIGWLAETEEQKLRASASKLWTFDDSPDDVKVGEFAQTELRGYIESREASLRHLATVSQTPVHELIGEIVNVSADALAAMEASHRRAVTENQTVLGEAHEQALNLASEMAGAAVDAAAVVRWRDTESRSLGQLVDALGKLVQMLGVPPVELWDRVADAMGLSQDQVERWKVAAAEGDAIAQLTQMLDRQATPPEPEPAPAAA